MPSSKPVKPGTSPGARKDDENALSKLTHPDAKPDLKMLEPAVKDGMAFLSKIEAVLSEAPAGDAIKDILEKVTKAQEPLPEHRTLVGVVGATGAGKSSVINAVLGEEMLLPTNCMRACTATATELAYNHSQVEGERYRAEIEFISAEEWKAEVEVLIKDLINSRGQLAPGINSPDSEAGIAWAKIRAVYPSMTKESLVKRNRSLADDPSVKKVLGSVETISSDNARDFSKMLQEFVESKDGGHWQSDNAPLIEYWPLIKVAKVYVKSQVLRSGLVLVDLPGVHDNNAARAAVAANYMMDCKALCIIAPITRAVNDKSAHTLLGEAFKRQLQFDGLYGEVTFICSKTDDISPTEVLVNLNDRAIHKLNDETVKLEEQLRELKTHDAADQIAPRFRAVTMAGERDFGAHRAMGKAGDDDPAVIKSPGKRLSLGDEDEHSPKTRRTAGKKLMDRYHSSDRLREADIEGETEKDRPTKPSPSKRLNPPPLGLLRTKKPIKKAELKENVAPIRYSARSLELHIREQKTKLKQLCIKARNEKTRPEIKIQFSDGLRELDQDAASEENEEDYDPDGDMSMSDASSSNTKSKPYDEIRDKLPVFCVSARAFQKLTGKLNLDEPVTGFLELSDTEIPQLRRHVQRLAEKYRAGDLRCRLVDMNLILTQLMADVVSAGDTLKQASQGRDQEYAYFKKLLKELEVETKAIYDRRVKRCREMLESNILSKFERASLAASRNAKQVVESWTKPTKDGGLPYATFKAACARDGCFQGTKRCVDFNSDLVLFLQEKIGLGWENFLKRALPRNLTDYCEELANLIPRFHARMKQREMVRKARAAGIFSSQLDILRQSITDIKPMMKLTDDKLKRSNRQFTPPIVDTMRPGYTDAIVETGPGCYKRMAEVLSTHVQTNGLDMFNLSTGKVGAELENMIGCLEIMMRVRAMDVRVGLERCYDSIVSSRSNVLQHHDSMRQKLKSILLDAEKRFEEIEAS